MKVGLRTPSPKKSLKARTTGKVKRAAKKAVNPMYGKKGTGFIKDPERSIKNAVYHRTTVGVGDIAKGSSGTKKKTASAPDPTFHSTAASQDVQVKKNNSADNLSKKDYMIFGIISLIIFFIGLYASKFHLLIRFVFVVFGFAGAITAIKGIIKSPIQPKDVTTQEPSDE